MKQLHGILCSLGLMICTAMADDNTVVFHHPDYLKTTITKTDNPFHIAIYGRGYFQFQMPDGSVGYSRLSEFKLDNVGAVVSKDGFALIPQIQLPSNVSKLEFSPDGMVVNCADQQNVEQFGQISLAIFSNPDGLQLAADGYLRTTEKSRPPIITNPSSDNAGFLMQGYKLEKQLLQNTPVNRIVNGENKNWPNDRQQEELIKTGRDLDFAINGPGFVAVKLPSGMMGYTRYLSLMPDEEGTLSRVFTGYWSTNHRCLAIEPQITLKLESTLSKTVIESEKIRKDNPALKIKDNGSAVLVKEVSSATSTNNVHREEPVGIKAEPGKPVEYVVSKETNIKVHNPKDLVAVKDVAKKLPIYVFHSPENLHYYLNGIYVPTLESGSAIKLKQGENGAGMLKQGYLNKVPYLEP